MVLTLAEEGKEGDSNVSDSRYVKFLTEAGAGQYSAWAWPLPQGDTPGEWTMEIPVENLEFCKVGYHFTDRRELLAWFGPRAFAVEPGATVLEEDNKLLTTTARLLRPLNYTREKALVAIIDLLNILTTYPTDIWENFHPTSFPQSMFQAHGNFFGESVAILNELRRSAAWGSGEADALMFERLQIMVRFPSPARTGSYHGDSVFKRAFEKITEGLELLALGRYDCRYPLTLICQGVAGYLADMRYKILHELSLRMTYQEDPPTTVGFVAFEKPGYLSVPSMDSPPQAYYRRVQAPDAGNFMVLHQAYRRMLNAVIEALLFGELSDNLVCGPGHDEAAQKLRRQEEYRKQHAYTLREQSWYLQRAPWNAKPDFTNKPTSQ